MAISKSKQTEWRSLKKHKDIQAIHDEKGLSKEKIRKAFNYGDADPETIRAIDSYFKSRKKQVA